MDWAMVLTIVGINIALFGAVASLIIWVVNKLDADMKGISSRMDTIGTRLDGHAQRIDQLYRMFVDLLKEGKK